MNGPVSLPTSSLNSTPILLTLQFIHLYTSHIYVSHTHTHTHIVYLIQKLTMALQVYSAAPRTSMLQQQQQHNPISITTMVCVAGDYSQQLMKKRNDRGLSMSTSFRLNCSLDATKVTEVAAEVGKVTEVNNDTFWPIVKAAGDKTVVLDMYTQWCGPCKIIAPKYQALSEKYDDVVFLKLDCNQDNKALAKELGIKVVPTFKILKDGEIVKEVTGAKYDDLVVAIENARST